MIKKLFFRGCRLAVAARSQRFWCVLFTPLFLLPVHSSPGEKALARLFTNYNRKSFALIRVGLGSWVTDWSEHINSVHILAFPVIWFKCFHCVLFFSGRKKRDWCEWEVNLHSADIHASQQKKKKIRKMKKWSWFNLWLTTSSPTPPFSHHSSFEHKMCSVFESNQFHLLYHHFDRAENGKNIMFLENYNLSLFRCFAASSSIRFSRIT